MINLPWDEPQRHPPPAAAAKSLEEPTLQPKEIHKERTHTIESGSDSDAGTMKDMEIHERD